MTKLFIYKIAGVREYWIVDPEKQMVSQYQVLPMDYDPGSSG